MSNFLLSDKSYQDHYLELLDELKLKIAAESDDYIIAQPTEDIVTYYQSYLLNPIEFDIDKKDSIEHKKYIKTIYSVDRDWDYRHDGDLKIESEKIIVKIPIIPNKDINKILSLRTQQTSLSGGPKYSVNVNYIIFEIEIKGYGIDLNIHQIGERILATKSSIHSHINSINSEINNENNKLKINLAKFIKDRKIKLDSDNKKNSDLVNLIKIPLARRADEIVKKIHIDTKPFVKKIKPKASEEQYQLDTEKVVDIIKLINNQCLQFEKTPNTYKKLDEPNLRDLLLSNFNSVFEGNATGETFNSKGKTDIYLNIDKGNILVFECKFYGGKILYLKTIDQILGYLTWRQNYGIMITFCKLKNFSKILGDAESIIKSHSSYESGYKVLTNTHFASKHTLPIDDYKYVELHHLFYNLYID